MTTIACDGVTVTADRLSVVADSVQFPNQIKLRRRGGYLFGLTGTACMFEACIEWYLGGADTPPPVNATPNTTYTFVVFFKDRAHAYLPGDKYPDVDYYPCAFGSGMIPARAALKAGADSRRAVQIAAELDLHTNKRITTRQLPERTSATTPSKHRRVRR